MARRKKVEILSDDEIISQYMELILSSGDIMNIDELCKKLDISKGNFLDYFDTIWDLERVIWDKLLKQSIHTIKSDEQYADFSVKEKLLSLMYTFFENLTLNRGYVLHNLRTHGSIKSRKKLFRKMKKTYIKFIEEIFLSNSLGFNYKLIDVAKTLRKKGLSESLWLQLTLLITFWRKDTSDNLDKTDEAIEKSVQVIMDILDTSRLKNFMDFGRFLWNEKSTFINRKKLT